MFSKIGIVISTTAGAGGRKVVKDLATNLFYWGVPKVYRFSIAAGAASWDMISKKNKDKIEKAVEKIARKVIRNKGKVKTGIKMKVLFNLMRAMQKNNEWSKADRSYWEEHQWVKEKRPWKAE